MVIDVARIPAACSRLASLSVARSPASAPISAASVERARGRLEDRGLAGARRAHHIDREQRPLGEMMPVVRRGPLVVREDPLLHLERHEVGIATTARITHHGTSITIWLSTISSPRRAAAVRRSRRSAGRRRAAASARHAGHSQRGRHQLDRHRRPSSHGVRTRNVRQAVSSSPASTPDSSPIRTRTSCTLAAPLAARAPSRCRRAPDDRVLMHARRDGLRADASRRTRAALP